MHLLPKAFAKPRASEPTLPEEESFVHVPSGLTLIRSMPQKEISPSATPSPAVTLFTNRFDPGPRPASIAVSILVHSVAVAIVWFVIAYKPPARVDTQHYTARLIDLHTPDQQSRAAMAGIRYPGQHPNKSKPASSGKPSPSPQPVLRQIAQAKPGPQTLIQPDLLAQVTLNEQIPVPQIVIWTPSKTLVKNIVPPLPQKPTAADIEPSYDTPNQEMTLANVNIASSFHPAPSNLVAASTTSPVAVHQPQQLEMPPVSATQNSAQPIPAAILSLSDLRAKDITATLPPVNESAASNVQGALAPGRAQDSSPQGSGNPAAKSGQPGAGPASAANPNASAPGSVVGSAVGPAGSAVGPAGSAVGPAGSAVGSAVGPAVAVAKPETSAPAQGANLTSESFGQPALTHIALPRDGHFSAVVVGVVLENEYPEAAGAWSGRIAYTAYLHVGLARSWIMQYSLPRDNDAAAGGTVARLDAPWPYNIVRPNLEPGSVDADALMIHGFIDLSGRFQGLSVAFPPAFPHAQFVLDALKQWQFRPAVQDGQPIRVEVLLLIPEDTQ